MFDFSLWTFPRCLALYRARVGAGCARSPLRRALAASNRPSRRAIWSAFFGALPNTCSNEAGAVREELAAFGEVAAGFVDRAEPPELEMVRRLGDCMLAFSVDDFGQAGHGGVVARCEKRRLDVPIHQSVADCVDVHLGASSDGFAASCRGVTISENSFSFNASMSPRERLLRCCGSLAWRSR